MSESICPVCDVVGGIIVAGIVVALIVGAHKDGRDIGDKRTREIMQAEAVKMYHAEFYLDANNERQWRWKTTAEQP